MHHRALYMSKLFRSATSILPKKHGFLSKSQRLLLYAGLIHSGSRGTYLLSPIFLRSLDKMIGLVDDAMASIDAEKLIMPSLGNAKLWKRSGRWDLLEDELFRLKDRHGDNICLAPTHEEEVTNYVASSGVIGHRHLPIRLYQITTKFRDELHPRYGLLRSREFLMKDLYTFDKDKESAESTYNLVCESYNKLLKSLDLSFLKVEATTGAMGGQFSHEFHIPIDIGEDEIDICDKCGYGQNVELSDANTCQFCKASGSRSQFRRIRAAEVGHCFLLGTKYSECFQALVEDQNSRRPMEMGCFGIGVTRLIGASLEALSTEEELRWPQAIVPFHVAIILQKKGATDVLPDDRTNSLINVIVEICPKDLIVDDRPDLTIGRKLVDLRRLGVPYVIVAKKQKIPDHFEMIDVYAGTSEILPLHLIAHKLTQHPAAEM